MNKKKGIIFSLLVVFTILFSFVLGYDNIQIKAENNESDTNDTKFFDAIILRSCLASF